VTGVTGAVQSAKLRLCVTTDRVRMVVRCSRRPTPGLRARSPISPSPGSVGNALDSLEAVATSTCYELDLDATVTGNGTFSYVVKGDVSDSIRYASSESTANNKPQLLVTTG
jgi:hypothetical protein